VYALELVVVLGVLLVVNLLTNRVLRHRYLQTCAVATVVLLVLGLWSGLDWTELGLGAGTYAAGLAWGAGCAVLVLVGYLGAIRIPYARRFFEQEPVAGLSKRAMVREAAVTIPVGTVLLEEVAFRGVLFGVVQQGSGTPAAVVWTAAMFGLWHVLPSTGMHETNTGVGATLGRGRKAQLLVISLTVLGTAAAGVVFGLLRVVSGSLIAPIGLHWATNGLGLVLAWRALRERPLGPAPSTD